MANLGLAQQSLRKEDAALATFRRTLELQPQHRDAQKRLAELLREQGKIKEAVAVYEKAIREQPTGQTPPAELYLNLGNLLQAAARSDLATPHYEKALELAPDSPAVNFNLGAARQQLYQVKEGRKLLMHTAELCPHKPFWRLRALSGSPVLFRNMDEIDAWRTNWTRHSTAGANRPPRRTLGNKLAEADAYPTMSLAYHGRNNRRLKEKFARLYERYFRGLPEPKGSGSRFRRRIGFVVTQRMKGSSSVACGESSSTWTGRRSSWWFSAPAPCWKRFARAFVATTSATCPFRAA